MSKPKIKTALHRQALAYMREEWWKEATGAVFGGVGGWVVGGGRISTALAGVGIGLVAVAIVFYIMGWRRAAIGAIETTATSGRDAKDTLRAAQQALTKITADRDGYKRNCEEIYEPQIRELQASVAEYRAAEDRRNSEFARQYNSLLGDITDLDNQIREVQHGKFRKVRTITARWPEWALVHGALDDINAASDELGRMVDLGSNQGFPKADITTLQPVANRLRELSATARNLTQRVYETWQNGGGATKP